MLTAIAIAQGLAAFAPSIARWLGGDKAAEVAETVVGIAKQVTGSVDNPVAALQANPQLALQFQQIWNAHELALYQEETKRLSEVNQTMRTEATAEDKWTRRWRPFWGFVSAVAFFLCVMGILLLAVYAVRTKDFELIRMIPDLVGELSFLFAVPGAILGITAWHRGVNQREQTRALYGGKGGAIEGLLSRLSGGSRK